MMKKPTRVVVMEPSPSNWLPVPVQGGEEARARFKHQVLLQDYEELLKETKTKKKKLQKTMQKKLLLMAEIKFLRRNYVSFVKKPTQGTPYRLKKQSHRMPSPSVKTAQPQNPVNSVSLSSKDTQQIVKEAAISRSCGLFDLNQISLPSAEEMQELPMELETLKADDSKRLPMEGGVVTSGFKRSVVRDVGNGSSKVGKRRISWQDQVALRLRA